MHRTPAEVVRQAAAMVSAAAMRGHDPVDYDHRVVHGQVGIPGDVLRGISAARRGTPRVQVLTGPPGSGRTRVLQAVLARPDLPDGYTVVDDVIDPDEADRLVAAHGGAGLLLATPRPLAAQLSGPSVDLVPLRPLREEEAAALLRETAAAGPLPDAAVAAAVRDAAGNPGALVLHARGLALADPMAGVAATTLDLPAEAVPAAFVDLLGGLPPAVTAAMRLLAVLGPVPPAALTAAVRRGHGPALDAEALGRAAWMDVVEVTGRAVRLVHPALGWAAWALAGRADRRRTSLALARHPRLPRPDAARHLIRAGVALDDDELTMVEAEAGRAAAAGAPAEAIVLMAGAATQATEPAQRARLFGAAGLTAVGAGQMRQAGTLLDQALDLETDPARRAELVSVAATMETLTGQPEVARWRLLGEVERLRGVDRDAVGRVLAALTYPDGVIGDMAAAIAHGEEAVAHGVLDGPLAGTVSGVLAHAHAVRGDAAAGDWADRVLAEVAADTVPPEQVGVVTLHVGRSLALLDRGADALTAVAVLEGRIARRGIHDAGAIPVGMRAEIAWRRGDWAGAGVDLADTIARSVASGQRGWRAFGLAIQARILAWQGDLEGAEAAVTAARADIDAGTLALSAYVVDAAAGVVAVAAGRPEEALDPLQRCLATDGLAGPISADQARYRPALVAVALALGRRELAEETRASTPVDACGTWSVGAVAMMDGLLATDDEEAVAHLSAAADAWGASPFDRSLAQLAAARRRVSGGMPAEDAAVAEAHATFQALGAGRLAAQAAALRTDTVPGLDRLGPVRRSVVLAAARGRRNAEIAQELGLSVRTVENHLHRAYRVLGVRSRAALVGLLSGGG